jgi:pimeloyl-[acyl-carrier protein] methyl ester esterase
VKPEVVFLSGFTLSRPVWQFQEKELSKNFTLKFFEQNNDQTFLGLAQRLEQSIHQPVHLMAHSMGGMVAQLFALHYPQKLKSLTLVCTSPKFISDTAWTHGIRSGAHKILDKQINQNLQEGLAQFVKAATADHLNDYDPQLLKIIRDASRTNKEFASNMMNELFQFNLLNEIKNIKTPTFILCGEKDPLCPPAASFTLKENILNSKLYEFKNEGHFPFLTQPALFNQKVIEFMTDHDSQRPR